MNKTLFLFAFTFIFYHQIHAQTLQPLDSVYLKSFSQFSNNIKAISEKVWPGMTIGPYCIFRIGGPVFLQHHPEPPANAKLLKDSIYMFSQADYALMGTSQTNINNKLTAQNNYGQPQYVTTTQFYAELFHELHHVYQRDSIKNLKFDNPADLVVYPENYKNDALRQYEDEVLLNLFLKPQESFQENLNKFYSCRKLRQTIIEDKYISYEKAVESAEGPATYCEYMYMRAYSSTVQEQEYIQKRFFYSLVEPAYGRAGLRNKLLLSGMVQCLVLSQHFKNWQPAYYASGLTLNDYFFSKFTHVNVALPDLSTYYAKAKYFTPLETSKHEANLALFNNQAGIKVTILFNKSPEFKGFDPMHAEAVNDSTIIHSTLLKLGKGDNYFNASNQLALTVISGSVWFVKTLCFFINDGTIVLENDTLKYSNKNMNISWRYLTQTKKGNEYIITVE
jgi:hypothetical protein